MDKEDQQVGKSRQTGQERERGRLQIMPCTVSQLLSTAEVNGAFRIGDLELNQISVVGVVRRCVPSEVKIQYSVDDMTGPPIDVTQWVNSEAPGVPCSSDVLGQYVKVIGSLRNIQGQRSLLAGNVRHVEDLNEITSHMLEVVQAHMQRSRIAHERVGDMHTNRMDIPGTVNSDRRVDGHSEEKAAYGLSTIQRQVWTAIKTCSLHDGISFMDLSMELGFLSSTSIRRTLQFLLHEGFIYSTIDEDHFKSI
ncbi:replication protein A 32 kDa subunit-A-like [Lampris incognitus]|uniref:replication protein A 32 kDa subunit-A-like n=1 Tax=Lampris incognitus TaxID=2546036 RepID=UPI0024B4A045|nr:replication protein A 32 kDa subunit-A-like [Lampris incognitus]